MLIICLCVCCINKNNVLLILYNWLTKNIVKWDTINYKVFNFHALDILVDISTLQVLVKVNITLL